MNVIPIEIYDQHAAVLGKTGAGKSFTLRDLYEDLLKRKERVCIVDPKGDHWGIKLGADGKSAGYPVIIFGGEHADIPLNPKIGKEVAELVATGNRPAVIDFRGWMPSDRTNFWIDFASTLFRLNRAPLWLFVDEIHNFAPQGKVMDVAAGKSLHWTNRIASEGRGIGIRLFMASQRPQKVHKDTLTCAETLIAMRVIHPLDRKAVKDWVDGAGDPERSKEVMNSLASMKRGEAYVWSPEIDFFEHMTFPPIKTFDSFKGPSSTKQIKLTGWANVNLDDVRNKLSQAIEEAKENDPKELKKQIKDLQSQVKTLENKKEIPGKPLIDTDLINDLRKQINFQKNKADHLQKFIDKLQNGFEHIKHNMSQVVLPIDKLINQFETDTKGKGFDKEVLTIEVPIPEKKNVVGVKLLSGLTGAVRREFTFDRNIRDDGINKLGKAQIKILSFLLLQPNRTFSQAQIGAMTGYRYNSGSFNTYLSELSSRGFIERNSGQIRINPDQIGTIRTMLEGKINAEEFKLSTWLNKLGKGPRAIFDVCLNNPDESYATEELAELTGYKVSGSFNTYLSQLSTLGLITREGGRSRLADEMKEFEI